MPSSASILLEHIPVDTGDGVDRSIPHPRNGVAGDMDSPLAVCARLAGLDVSGVDDEAALTAAVDCEKLIAYAHAMQARALARFRQLRADTEEFVADEIAPALAWTRNAAAGRVAVAVDLTTRLTAALDALRVGRLDLYKARILAEDTTALSDEQARDVAERVLPRASEQNSTAFRRSLRRAILRVDPDGQTRRHQTARADRRVVLQPLPDGMAELVATLPAEHATAIYHRIDTLARRGRTTGDTRSADARRADAFTALLLDQPTSTSGHLGLRPLVQVTIAATTLAGADNLPGELAGYGPLPAAIARRIATDPTGTWRRLVTDPVDGSLLDYGRRTYRPPVALADHVRARDATCVFPGCHHRADRADLDHTMPYPKGPTNAGNLTALCRRHHRLKHHTQWTIVQRDGRVTWTSPTGRTYTRHPQPPALRAACCRGEPVEGAGQGQCGKPCGSRCWGECFRGTCATADDLMCRCGDGEGPNWLVRADLTWCPRHLSSEPALRAWSVMPCVVYETVSLLAAPFMSVSDR